MQHGYTLKTHIFHINYSLSLDFVYLQFDVDKLCYSMMLYIIATKTWKRAQTRGNILVKLRPWESHDCGKREWSRNLFTMSLWQLLVWEFRGNTFQSARLSSFSRLTWLLGDTPEAQILKSVALLSHGQKLRCFRPFQSFLGEIWNLWWLYTNQTFWNIWTHISHHLINNRNIYHHISTGIDGATAGIRF